MTAIHIFSVYSNLNFKKIEVTKLLHARLAKHNAGDVPHTSKFKPWKIEVYIAFETEEKAIAFESYLKSCSGHAFAKRHF